METIEAHVEDQPSQALIKATEAKLARATDAPATITDQRIVAVGEMLREVYAKASDLILTPEEQKALAEPFADDEIEILPTGELYVPHILIRERLGRVLGTGQWSIVGLEHNVDGKTIHIHFIMTCRRAYVGESWVTKEYISNNPRSSWSDTIEGAEGEAVRRIAAKRLNCGNQVWKPAYGRVWIPKYAVQVWRKQREDSHKANQPQWRRKDCPPFYDETGVVGGGSDAPPSRATAVTPRKQPPIPADKGSMPAVRQRKADFLANATEAGEMLVWAYCVRNGHLPKITPLQNINEAAIPDWNDVAADLAVNDTVSPDEKAQYEKVHAPDGVPGLDDPTPPPTGAATKGGDSWRTFPVPFGPQAGVLMDKLDKNKLFGWWANYEPKPYQGQIKDKDKKFREMLDEAGVHYGFVKKA